MCPIPERLRQAAQLLAAGELVAFPTETVYGLGADAANPAAVAKIFAAKGRPADHPLIVHLAATEQLAHWATDIPQVAWDLAASLWPGPLTLILKKQPWAPTAVTGGQDTVGLRVPNHPLALELLAAFAAAKKDAPAGIAAPSANRFGRISPTTAAHVHDELGARVALIVDGGPCQVGIESTIIDLSRATPEILRPGVITGDDLARVMGRIPRPHGASTPPSGQGAAAPRVSGSLSAHYAPRTALRLVASAALVTQALQLASTGQRVAVLAHGVTDPGDHRLIWHAAAADPSAYAHDLYASLRTLDTLDAHTILVEDLPPTTAWRAVADRLGRAATGSGRRK
ncbi:threonylcarbamoyl-AMP synthase [Betaproteobacteria bacterium]|nr:threonylcarbamoyl-AMP synthase [Betaproteobacteria bacterium]GHU00266.1 threonylcarbamoyl-AMP synthase [Betaproteobacteria bacterium]GHU23671.1 threonylcarbamoyl-AMP synthase [Betaproteobacteria bacterium]